MPSGGDAPNSYDRLVVDVQALFEAHPPERKAPDAAPNAFALARSGFHRLYRARWIPLSYRKRWWRMARQSSLDLSWFDEFRAYWSGVLRGRPLWTHYDFFFLRNLYRMRFGRAKAPASGDSQAHLTAWQQPEILYQLLHGVAKESLIGELTVWERLRRHAPHARRFFEFGCGTAPVTTAYFEFFHPPVDVAFRLSDIQTIPFHYAAHKFRSCSNVTAAPLLPADNFMPSSPAPLDVIFALTVFEHLPRPLEVAQTFHRLLARGGILVFDYIKGEGQGLDTRQGCEQRDAVLDFLAAHFDLAEGALDKDRSMGLTFLRKR